ncbi:MAG: ATP-dependent nuclease [Phycisphaerae bacterium]
MYISEIKIDGFRCFKNAHFYLQRGVNAVIGRNNTGKSNLFSAIRHALGPSAARGDPLWLTEDDFCRDIEQDERGEFISIELIFDGLTTDDRARFFELLDYDTQNPEKTKAKLTFEANWPKGKKYADSKRWGGAPTGDRAALPQEVLSQIPVTFLPALRDAEAALTPGNRSRLALLLQDLARRDESEPEKEIVEIYKEANAALEKTELVQAVRSTLRSSTEKMAGTDYSSCSITASPAKLDRILKSLRVQMDGTPIEDISANGLGYNNILYIATILTHLANTGEEESPLLLVEEPEAHLHPQLTLLLAEHLNSLSDTKSPPQIIVSTHSPTLASHVQPSRISVTFADRESGAFRCNSLTRANLSGREERELRRMMDVTRATLYFAKGLILVEGISEALLMPAISVRLGYDLLKRHISVLPICGVSFGTFSKLLGEKGLDIPAAIITDGDPPKTTTDWATAKPKTEAGKIVRSGRANAVADTFKDRANVGVFVSKVTLEYDLAAAGEQNPTTMTEEWEKCFVGTPQTLNSRRLADAGDDLDDRTLAVWRGICVADHSGSKAEFANRLAERILERDKQKNWAVDFQIPGYLRKAIEFVWKATGGE